MIRCTFESLPNELILLVFEYLSLFDLYQAFSHLGYTRLVQLFLSKRHSFVVGSLRCELMCRLLDVNNDLQLKWLTDLIETLVLDDSLASSVFLDHITKRMDPTQSVHFRLASMTQLIIFKADQLCNQLLRSLLLPINFCDHALQRVHLVFERPTYGYSTVLSTLVSNRISFPTMILEVENGYDFEPDHNVQDLHRMAPIYWPYTNQLTLSIQHASELELLLKRNATPTLEHLAVTIEQMDLVVSQQSKSRAHFCGQTLLQKADGTRLRSLFIRQMAFDDLLVLIDFLAMPSLEKLTLIDIYANTSDSVHRFQEICCSGRLPALKDLYFSFRFPSDLGRAWAASPCGTSDQWPFNHIGCFMNECLVSDHLSRQRVPKMFFIVYKHPINVLLKHTRSLFNDSFARHASELHATNPSYSLQWVFNPVNELDRILKTFRTIRAVHGKSLCITYLPKGRTMEIVSSNCLRCNSSRNRRQERISIDASVSATASQRASIVRQVLDASPKVTHLTVHWCDLPDSSSIYSHLQSLHLILEHSTYRYGDLAAIDIDRLYQLVPGLRRLETSANILMRDEKLVAFIFDIITRFRRLVHLVINTSCHYRISRSKTNDFLRQFVAACKERGYDGSMIDVRLYGYDGISVWL